MVILEEVGPSSTTTSVFTERGNLDADRRPQGGCPVKMEAERGDASTSEEHQRLPADQRHWEQPGQVLRTAPGGAGPASSLVSDLWPPQL